MRHNSFITARRVIDETDRRRAVEILASTYHREKQWVTDAAAQIPVGDLERRDIAWFIATLGDYAAGTLRVWYDPTYTQYAAYGLKLPIRHCGSKSLCAATASPKSPASRSKRSSEASS